MEHQEIEDDGEPELQRPCREAQAAPPQTQFVVLKLLSHQKSTIVKVPKHASVKEIIDQMLCQDTSYNNNKDPDRYELCVGLGALRCCSDLAWQMWLMGEIEQGIVLKPSSIDTNIFTVWVSSTNEIAGVVLKMK